MATAKNTNIVRSIAAPAGAVGDDCTHVSLWDAAANGNLLGTKAISTDPDALALGEKLEFAAEALVINQPAGADETAAMAERAVRGKIAGGVWVQFHSGAPGANGTDNVISELNRVSVAQAAWTVAQ
ncbi:MAG: hypothetical protein OXL36_19715 [Bryobacterales bacterium]|nr:hypothetical protein [Bryobacterales bacterium]MDE0294634.1 hypothetical protein [Bryobacterales bacterium]